MNLYLRLFSLLLRLIGLRQKPLLEESRVMFRVLPTDCDLNLHMNNGRYLAFMDLGRVHLMAQAGVLGRIVRHRWQPVLMAAEINFIRALKPLQRFELATRVVTWDDKYAYLEQRFEVQGRLCAHAFLRTLFLRRGRKVPVSTMIALLGISEHAPPMPEALRIWAELGTVKKQNA